MEVAMMAAAGLRALGSVVGAAEESANLKAVQDAAHRSEIYAREDARTELRIATADAEQQRRRGREAVAEQTAAFAQSGFAVTGDAVSAIAQSEAEAELDALQIQYKGVLRNRAGLIEAQGFAAQKDAARRGRRAMPFKAALGAATNLLSGYASSQGGKVA